MRFVLWAVLCLVAIGVIAVIAVIGVAIFSDLPAPTREITLPVTPR